MRALQLLPALCLSLLLPSLALAQQAPAPDPDAALHPLEQQVASLRADVGRTAARLRNLLGEEGIGAARVSIAQESHMSSLYRLERAQYAVDGHVVSTQLDDHGSLAGRAGFDVFGGALAAGPHVLTLSLGYRGDGLGVFDYARGYAFTLRSSVVLEVPESGVLHVRVVTFEDGGLTGPMDRRPSVRYLMETARAPR